MDAKIIYESVQKKSLHEFHETVPIAFMEFIKSLIRDFLNDPSHAKFILLTKLNAHVRPVSILLFLGDDQHFKIFRRQSVIAIESTQFGAEYLDGFKLECFQ